MFRFGMEGTAMQLFGEWQNGILVERYEILLVEKLRMLILM